METEKPASASSARYARSCTDGSHCSPGKKKVAVFGLGYVGLPVRPHSPAAASKWSVSTFSPRSWRPSTAGAFTLCEPDLDMVVQAAVASGKLRASVTPEAADVFIIAVPTPFKEGHVAGPAFRRAGDRDDGARC